MCEAAEEDAGGETRYYLEVSSLKKAAGCSEKAAREKDIIGSIHECFLIFFQY